MTNAMNFPCGCPVSATEECKNSRKAWQVACVGHWYKLPSAIRSKVSYLTTHREGSPELRGAVEEAKKWLADNPGPAARGFDSGKLKREKREKREQTAAALRAAREAGT